MKDVLRFLIPETRDNSGRSSLRYYPFGSRFGDGSQVTAPGNEYLYNGKELQDELGLNWYDYGARMYDPSIGRWNGVDALAENRNWITTYNYVQNNPIIRIDPNGLTDYTFNKKTGEVTQVGEENDDPDRILKTNRKNKVKKKGEGLLGFLVRKSERGKVKVGMNGIKKGILKDGMNFKTDENVIGVNGDNQPSLADVEDFLTRFSEYISLEMSGTYLSPEAGVDAKISHVYIGEYEDNGIQNSNSRNQLIKKAPYSHLNWITHYHTHLTNIGIEMRDVIIPHKADVQYKSDNSAHYKTFIILYRTTANPSKVKKRKY